MKVCGQSNDAVQHIYCLLLKGSGKPQNYHICLVRFLRIHMPKCKGTFYDFCKSLQLLFMCLCVCARLYIYATGLVRLFATLNIVTLIAFQSSPPVVKSTGEDDWNAISVLFQEHRKWEFWKCRNKIFLTLLKNLIKIK